jgi:acyl transferase domain-containing protein
MAVKLAAQLSRELSREVSAVLLFELPTVAQLAARLDGNDSESALAQRLQRFQTGRTARQSSNSDLASRDIAIIGMSGRFPGSPTVAEFWQNLAKGREGITFFEPDQLDDSLPSALKLDPHYVRARGIIADYDKFDAPFFGVTPAEAALMDPQQRVLLEVAWETLEDGGYVPDNTDHVIGIYAGKYNDTYYSENVLKHADAIEQFGSFNTMLANEKDYVATRTAYSLNLTGPAISVHTACSTSLVCVVQAMQALRNFDCDLALAGGVSITVPVESGYLYQEGTMLSADGHTKTFSNQSTGTVFSDGASMVLLKRLDDALRDGDNIRAVLRGGAINNDGSNKASFTAPSVLSQALVIARAHQDAGVSADQISYVEAHGTATQLGDPVEFEALKQAFSLAPTRGERCGIGSAKSNVGHTVISAGTTGVIKTALSLENELIPATLFFEEPNPALGLEESSFYVTKEATPWKRTKSPRHAGVSSFGVGGTNAHVVMTEAPTPAPQAPSARKEQLLFVSARSDKALRGNLAKIADYLEENETLQKARLEDIAFTLHAGRKAFPYRAAVVCTSSAQGAALLRSDKLKLEKASAAAPRVAFLFPGQGSQYPQMGASLYRSHSLFRSLFDHCAEILQPHLGAHLRDLIFAEGQSIEAAADVLRRTEITQPALFTIEYCLAELWKTWGLHPFATIGHSVGEFVSAVLAGVFSLEDALNLVAHRGRLMGSQPPGGMLSVRLGAAEVEPRLTGGLCMASDNSPSLCVVAGPSDEIAAFENLLTSEGVACRLLVTSHAFHSSMMDPVAEPFLQVVRGIKLNAPQSRFISTATGTWITPEEATDPHYWARHMRQPVRFSSGIQTLLQEAGPLVFVEVGPRLVLSTLVGQQTFDRNRVACVASLGNEDEKSLATLLTTAGKLFTQGITLDPAGVHGPEQRRRVSLPTYAFDHKRYWLDGKPQVSAGPETATDTPAAQNVAAPPATPPAASGTRRRGHPVVSEQLLIMQKQLDVLLTRRLKGR